MVFTFCASGNCGPWVAVLDGRMHWHSHFYLMEGESWSLGHYINVLLSSGHQQCVQGAVKNVGNSSCFVGESWLCVVVVVGRMWSTEFSSYGFFDLKLTMSRSDLYLWGEYAQTSSPGEFSVWILPTCHRLALPPTAHISSCWIMPLPGLFLKNNWIWEMKKITCSNR